MSSTSPRLRMAVIGVGALGRHHARILSTLPGVELVGVADPNPQQGQDVAKAVGCTWTHDYRTLLPRIDAASVVVPTFLHANVASELLQRGIHVLIEKPLAATVEEGEYLCALAEEQGVTLQVGHIERFNPAYVKVREWSQEPKYIQTERFSPYPFRSLDIGVVLDLMIHDIDLVLDLAGKMPARIEAFGVSLVGGHEDCAQARLHFPHGAIADLAVNRVCPTPKRSIQVWSNSGCATADLHQRQVTCYGAGPDLQAGLLPYELARHQLASIDTMKEEMFRSYISVEAHQCSNEDALTAELTDFVTAIHTKHSPRVNGLAGLNALQVARAVISRIQGHCWDGTAAGRQGHEVFTSQLAPIQPDIRKAA